MISACAQQKPNNFVAVDAVEFQAQDKQIAEQLFQLFEDGKKPRISELMIKVGSSFMGAPYVANTLEVGDSEKLVVNLHEFDCNTFAESCLALSHTIKAGNPTFEKYINELAAIRYRHGVIEGYPSRLHYFSDWVDDNQQKKKVRNMTATVSTTIFPNRVNFMSSHPDSYKHLKNNPGFVAEIKKQENDINQRETCFIPKSKVEAIESQLKDGDIIGITTSITGLDVSHVGIIIKQKGRVYMLHASSTQKKVTMTDMPLLDYLQGNKFSTGIIVARPL